MKIPFRFKVCGVRSRQDVASAAAAGATAVGLNFFPKSVRYIEPAVAAELHSTATAEGLVAIGLFVNEPLERVSEICASCDLRWVQLHGDESPDYAMELGKQGVSVIRAVRIPAGPVSSDEIEACVAPWLARDFAILMDADAGAAYGGEGLNLDWDSLGKWAEASHTSYCLAGGLDAENVRQAITSSHCDAVDVASGVESSRGVKSANRMTEFGKQLPSEWLRS